MTGPIEQPLDPFDQADADDAARRRRARSGASRRRGKYKIDRTAATPAQLAVARKNLLHPNMKSHVRRRDGGMNL